MAATSACSSSSLSLLLLKNNYCPKSNNTNRKQYNCRLSSSFLNNNNNISFSTTTTSSFSSKHHHNSILACLPSSSSSSSSSSSQQKQQQHNKTTNNALFTNKLYVSGLSFRTTEESLRNAFQSFGQLIEVNLVMDKIANRPRGFAFLRYATKEESDKAIEGMHGKFLDGRVIFVEFAKPRSQLNQGVKQDSKPYR